MILAVGTFAQAAATSFTFGVPMLVPALRDSGLSLFAASVLVSAPVFGQFFGLIPWGAAADRHGERIVIVRGVGLGALLVLAASFVHVPVLFGVLLAFSGTAGAAANAASGRVVMGWFPPTERGLAMGARQTAQPIGVGLAALGLPGLARAHGPYEAMLYPAALALLAVVLVRLLLIDPPRPQRAPGAAPAASPYRGSRQLLRIHLASACLVVPQFAIATFTLVYLVGQRHWDAAVAGRMIFAFTIAGALGRVAAGVWSDRVASRLRPMRQLALCSAAILLALGIGAAAHSWLVIVAFAVGSVITVADNGLAYTSVAEVAGPEWAGRALGVQNTFQGIAAVVTPPVLAAIIGNDRYPLGFVLVAVVALVAIPLIPLRAERELAAACP